MTLPERTAAERGASLEAANEVRHRRAQIKEDLKSGKISYKDIIDQADDPVVGKMKLITLLESLPGFGKATASTLMKELGIAECRRISGLGKRQSKLLLDALEARSVR